MPRARGDYGELLDRIQERFDIDDITPDAIADWLSNHDDRGKTLSRRRLGTMLSGIINRERQVTLSFTIGDDFARERGIKLSDKVTSKVYDKWGSTGRKAVVIRDERGHFKAWKYL